ncbi:MAG: phosphoenolpyruvate--protein phosphotransferase [Deltaproteobacteria bacterium]|jgi:phosphotransferase system enzyme I (PtsI)|nr:phosphoenolpyruvate--protein phosphotransferase [Deltaproteobacteria bacterium]
MLLKGVPASPGIGVGRAFVWAEPSLDYGSVVFAGEEAELARLRAARRTFADEAARLAKSLKERGSVREGDMIEGHAVLLEDDFLTEEMENAVRSGSTAEAAAAAGCDAVAEIFMQTDDETIRARAADMRAIRDRLLGYLLHGKSQDLSEVPPGTVFVTRELTPYMATGFRRGDIEAILTEEGGKTSHSAILARAMGIPAVMGVHGAVAAVASGMTVAVDGDAGVAEPDPEPARLADFLARQRAWRESVAALGVFRGRRTEDLDGTPRLVCANIASLKEAEMALENGCEGVGLFRTEMLFMDRQSPPSEDEQADVYRRASEAMAWRELVIRTMDIGGDKEVPYLDLPKEPNPFLGYRAVRFSLDRPELFRTQLRAIFRAAAGRGNVKCMIPLVTGCEELEAVKAIAEGVRGDLAAAGVPFNAEVPLGIMVETPAAVQMADALARRAAFFSIGTNDLTQYTLAADRLNPRVDYLYSHFHPAVLRSVERVVRAAKAAGIPVGMCGEAAGAPGLVPVYMAFGLDEWSVNPASVLPCRREISLWSAAGAREVAEGAMALETAAEVKAYLEEAARNPR